MTIGRAVATIQERIEETLSYHRFSPHWRRIRTSNPLESIMRDIWRRTSVVGCSPDGNSARLRVGVRLRHIARSRWGMKQYLKMDRIEKHARELAA